MGTIDVSQQVSEMERVLRSRESTARSLEALAVLERWQWDEMLDAVSRSRARRLIREFGAAGERAGGAGFWGPPSMRHAGREPVSGEPNSAIGLRDRALRAPATRLGVVGAKVVRPTRMR